MWCRTLGEYVRVSVRNVLVVGAGVAGSTLAHWLARWGIETTVVEKAGGQRSSGAPVDVRGPALPVVEQMHVLTSLREAATFADSLIVVDGRGRRIGSIPTQANTDAVEIPRGALTGILIRAASTHADFRYGDSVLSLHDDGQGVDVSFEHGASRRFDLVVGADGLHSRVRRLIFGPESQFLTHLGLSLATTALKADVEERSVVMHNAPGRAVALHPAAGREMAAFIFRSPVSSGMSDQCVDHAKQLVFDTYSGMGWRVPELLDRVRDSADLYFDSVSRVRLDSWSQGRVVLLGDAASGVSLLGDGSSMAIAGAAALARELGAQPNDPAEALVQYERAHRKRVLRRQRGVAFASRFLVPATRAGIIARNIPFRLWPVVARARCPLVA